MTSIPAKVISKKLLFNETTLARFLEHNEGKTCDLVPRRLKRTLTQLAYVHVLFQYIADETGMTKEDAKTVEKRRHLTPRDLQAFGHSYKALPSLSTISKDDMAAFIERVLADCAFLNITVPTHEELGYLPN